MFSDFALDAKARSVFIGRSTIDSEFSSGFSSETLICLYNTDLGARFQRRSNLLVCDLLLHAHPA